jgi:TetR/AcrR family transcriptional regulator, acrAB operon repressor
VRRTKQESEQTRQQILVAARREFAAHGVTRTTLQRIAAAAGVTRGAVYWHFANKRELFREMREQVSVPLFDHTELVGDDDPDPLRTIEHFLRGVIDQIAADLQTRRTFDILALKCEYVDEFRPELKRHARRCHELMSKFALVYERARDMGAMRSDIAPDIAALGTCVFVTGMLRLWLMDEDRALLRARVDPLIAGHIAMLRAPAGPGSR